MRNDIVLLTDVYKFSHWNQTPPGITECYSYFESRGGDYENVVFFGLQAYIKKYFLEQITTADIDEAERRCATIFGNDKVFNRKLWDYIVEHHDGYLPIRIKAVAEGSIVPTHNVLMTIENTDSNCYWLTNYVETRLSHVWYTCTVATNSYECKRAIARALEETSDALLSLDFAVHDFGYRGVASEEVAALGGMAHLTSFKGSDTTVALLAIEDFYGGDDEVGFSVPAAEHYTITSWGRDREIEAYRNMLEQYPVGIVSVVSDSYDIFNAVENIWGGVLRDEVMKRDGKLVIRPDSGDPVEVNRRLLHIMWEKFGGSVNAKGFKVLDPHVGIIQGDGIDLKMIERMLVMVREEGFSAENFVFGSGGGLLQKFNRDTMKFAIKASNVVIDGHDVPVSKDPITDSVKRSKRGKLKLVRESGGTYRTVELHDPQFAEFPDELEVVFENGRLVRESSFKEIRRRILNAQLEEVV